MNELIRQNLLQAQQRMKTQADKNRQEHQFSVGDWVYLKLQPFVQHSITRSTNRKLSFRFFGPYLVTQKVGAVAYKLQLPEGSQIHPVIHVSQLKKAIPPEVVVSPDAELNYINTNSVSIPMQVLQKRLHQVGNKMVPFARVQWDRLPPSWTTWEKLHLLPPQVPGV
jgi:hypothetical protein